MKIFCYNKPLFLFARESNRPKALLSDSARVFTGWQRNQDNLMNSDPVNGTLMNKFVPVLITIKQVLK